MSCPRFAVQLGIVVSAISIGVALPQDIGGNPPISLGGHFYLERSHDEFGIRSHGIIERKVSGSKFYPLPQSTVDMYNKLRREDLRYMLPHKLTAGDYARQEVIGPYQEVGERIWFGNQYYDGEGERGVGRFGYFDKRTRQYVLFSPPEIARWEISALLMEPGNVWLGLDHFGEDISTSPGGLVRWDTKTLRIRHYALEFVIKRIRRERGNPAALRLETDGGYALFTDGQVNRFRVVKSATGTECAIAIKKFPPPPSHY